MQMGLMPWDFTWAVLDALMEAFMYAWKLCWAAGMLLECTPDANRATTNQEVDDASRERINLIGTKSRYTSQ